MIRKFLPSLAALILIAGSAFALTKDSVYLPAATDKALSLFVAGDTVSRLNIRPGIFEFGGGSDAVDVVLSRSAANTLQLASGDTLDIVSTLALAGTAITSTAAELNVLDGITAAVAELNYLDITTLGTGAASKAVVLDASGDYTFPATGTIVFPASSSLTLDASSTFAVATTASFTGDVTGDGGDQFYGFLHDQVASTTVGITAAQADKTFVSNSADTMTLPEASTVLGARYTFVCGTADDFVINPADGTDQIGTVASITGTNTTTVLAPAAGDSITCTDIGSSIVLEAVGADLWASIGTANGIWTDTN